MIWATVRLGDEVAAGRAVVQTGPFGSQLHQHDYVDDGVPVVMPKDIVDGDIDLSGVARVGDAKAQAMARHALSDGDIVFPRRGDIRKCALVTSQTEGSLCGTGCLKIQVNSAVFEPKFLYYLMSSNEVGSWLEGRAVGTTMLNLSAGILTDLVIPAPPLLVQASIVSTVSAYDDLIDNNRRRIKLLEDSVRLLFDEWFVSTGSSSWPTSTLQQLCTDEGGIQTGPFGSQLHQSDYSDEGVPVVMPKDLATMRIDTEAIARIPEHLADELGRHRMRRGDIVFGRRGEIGRRAFIGRRQEGYFCGTGCLRLRPDPARVHPRYLFEILRAPAVAGDIANRAKGSTMANLSAGALQGVTVPVPPRELQDRFASFADDVSEQTDTLDEQSRKLRTARDLLLPRLMSGELTV